MQPSDVKIEHKEHGRVDETGNAEKVMCLHFVGLQADGAGLGDGSLGFLAPRFTLGCHQAKVCEIPSPITHPVQGYSPATHEVHISTRVLS